MNWDQYFKLKSKQKKYFLIFLVALLLLNLSHVKNFVIEGSDFVCDKINVSSSLENLDVSNSQTDSDNLNLTDITGNIAAQEKTYKDYVWFDCELNYDDLSLLEKATVWKHRLTYTPLFILKNIVFAYILSVLLYSYNLFKIEHKKAKEEDSKEEPKEETKKK